MKAFEYYLARERVDGIRRNAIRVDARRRERRLRRALTCLAAVLPASVLVTAIAASSAPAASAEAYADMETAVEDGRLPGDDIPASVPCALLETDGIYDQPENELIQATLLEKAQIIEDCTVTWYTADTCGKLPGDPGYGITASGLPVVEHLTCAVDKSVIPLYSDVFVQYADGTIEQLWATDTGVRGNHIDIYTPDYETAIQNGRQKLTVWWLKED